MFVKTYHSINAIANSNDGMVKAVLVVLAVGLVVDARAVEDEALHAIETRVNE